MIRVVVNGAKGKMGSSAVNAIKEHSDLTVVGEVDLGDNLQDVINATKPQVVLDFTIASVGFTNCKTIIECGVAPVIGTSGFTREDYFTLKDLAKKNKIGGIIVPNFALGAVLMMKFAKEAAKYMNQVEIIERHHDQKEESPSGTALRTAELIIEGQLDNQNLQPRKDLKGKELLSGCRGGNIDDIAIHSLRIKGSIAHQEVIFGNIGETLTFRHDSISRDSFMPGVCLALTKAPFLNELVFGLENIML